jgi:hypothetical protein
MPNYRLTQDNHYKTITAVDQAAAEVVAAQFSGVWVVTVTTDELPNLDSILAIEKFSNELNLDYHQKHLALVAKCAEFGFSNLTLEEKDIVATDCATDDNTIVAYFATVYTGGDLLAAVTMHTINIGVYVSKLQPVAVRRIEDPRTNTAVMFHLKDRSQIDLFIAAIRNYSVDYKQKFHIGTGYSDSTDGIMDFIENTGSHFADGDGLDGFQFSALLEGGWLAVNALDPNNPTLTELDGAHDYVRDLLILKLKNILVYGNFD